MLPALTALLLAQLLGEAVVRSLGLPVPGPVLGLVCVLLALWARPAWVAALKPTAQTLLATDKVSSLHIYLNEMADTDHVAAQLREQAGNTLEVRDWLQLAQFYQSVKDLYNRIFGFLGVIMLVIVVLLVVVKPF